MGMIRMGPPLELVLFLKEQAAASYFVETGTYRGETASWAERYFDHTYTIELSASYHAAAMKRFDGSSRVTALQGRSEDVLTSLLKRIDGPAVFWLDAHWSGLDTAGKENECPILAELAVLNAQANRHVILVDDARLFGALL